MSPPDLAYSTKALRKDADLWEGASQTMKNAENTIKGLHLGEFSFGYLASKAGLTTAYENLRQTMETWAKQGHDVMLDGSSALREVARIYEEGEQKSIDEIKRAWHL